MKGFPSLNPIDRGMDREDRGHIHNEVLLSPKKSETVPFAETQTDLETIIQSEVSQKEKNKHRISTHVCEILRDGPDEPVCRAAIKTQTQRTDLWNLGRGGGAGRRGWDECREQHGSVRVTTHEIESQWR